MDMQVNMMLMWVKLPSSLKTKRSGLYFFFLVGLEVFYFLYILNYCLQQMGQEVLHPNSPYGIDQAMLLSHAYETVGIISEL